MLVFAAVCGDGWGALEEMMYLHVSRRIMGAEVSPQLCRRLLRGALRFLSLSLSFFFFFSQNRPRAGSWRWKMSGLTAFERFILQRWCTFITVTSINDILSCKLEMHQGCFFFFFFSFFFKTSKTKQWTKCVLSAEIECCAWYLSESHFLSTLEI